MLAPRRQSAFVTIFVILLILISGPDVADKRISEHAASLTLRLAQPREIVWDAARRVMQNTAAVILVEDVASNLLVYRVRFNPDDEPREQIVYYSVLLESVTGNFGTIAHAKAHTSTGSLHDGKILNYFQELIATLPTSEQ